VPTQEKEIAGKAILDATKLNEPFKVIVVSAFRYLMF